MFSIFLVISLKNTYINKSVTKNISTKYLRRKSSSALFPPDFQTTLMVHLIKIATCCSYVRLKIIRQTFYKDSVLSLTDLYLLGNPNHINFAYLYVFQNILRFYI